MELNALEDHYSKKEILTVNKRDYKIKKSTKKLKNLFSFIKAYKFLLIATIIIMIIIIIKINILSKSLPERFYGIIPSFVKLNSFGFFESDKNGLENIPKSKIDYIRKEYGYIQKIEQSQMGNIEENIENSIQADITIYHSKFNFHSKIMKYLKKKGLFLFYY